VPSLDALKQLQLILARQPGYKGYIAVESENTQRVFVRLWESEAAAQAANESDELKVFRAKISALQLLKTSLSVEEMFYTSTYRRKLMFVLSK